MEGNQIRSLFSRNHDTVFPKLGVFLGGPTPPDGQMLSGWRRKVVDALKADERLDPKYDCCLSRTPKWLLDLY
jgi:hypothetical protein